MLSTNTHWREASNTLVSEFLPGVRVLKTVVSPDIKHVAYVADMGETWCVVVGHRVDAPCLSVSALTFSAVGGHLAYIAVLSEECWCVVRDGRFGRRYDEVSHPIFSPDGEHLVYEATRDGRTYLVLDEEELGPFDFIAWAPVWSPDSRHLAYPIEDEAGMHVVLDGQPGPSWTLVSELQFHPATNELIYLAESQNRRCVILGEDTVEIAGDNLSDLVCHPAIRQFAVQVYVDGGVRIYTLQAPLGPFCNYITTFIFSPDGGHCAYAAEIDGHHYVLLDHTPGQPFDDIHPRSLTFSPDGSRLLYIASVGEQQLLVEHMAGETTPYDEVHGDSLRFSPNSAHFAFAARSNDQWHIVTDAHPSESHDKVGMPVFSSNSKHLAYRVRDGKIWRIVIDGQTACQPYAFATDPHIAQGSDTLAYLAEEGNLLRYVEVKHEPIMIERNMS